MSEYFDKRIDYIALTIDYDGNGKPWLCANINLSLSGRYEIVSLTKAELRKVLEQLEAL
jgi:hypothetical protein